MRRFRVNFGASLIRHRVVIPKFRLNTIRLRSFANDRDVLNAIMGNQVSRVSLREKRAGELITAIREKNYERANQLVLREGVNVDGHTALENTALTDCAMRNDVEGINHLVTKLKANLHASCDCPDHNTAMHYAAMHGNVEALNELQRLGANPYVQNKRSKSAIQAAKNNETKMAIETNLKKHRVLRLPNTTLTLPK
jgi:ankyrin repeat protein